MQNVRWMTGAEMQVTLRSFVLVYPSPLAERSL
jgi:hypothetical protein